MLSKKFKSNKYVEDTFDLDKYKQEFINQISKNYNKKNKTKLMVSSFLIFIFSIFLFFIILRVSLYYVGVWKNVSIASKTNKIMSISNTIGNKKKYHPNFYNNDEYIPNKSMKAINPMLIEAKTNYKNDDIIGFIKIDGTNINHFVTQYSDNDFYLHKDLFKRNNIAGSIFMDFECNSNNLSQNTILYGHNMKDGSMFENLKLYSDKNFFDTHKYVEFKTLSHITKWEIFAFYDTSVEFDYIKPTFDNEYEFYRFISNVKKKSLYPTKFLFSQDDKILTLSTCKNDAENKRYVIHAKLIENNIF